MTLVEVIVATSIAGMVGVAVMGMSLSIARINFDSTAKLLINKDVRSFTNQLSQSTRSARMFKIYSSPGDLAERSSGQAGDVLVLLWAQPESIEDAEWGDVQEYYYEKIVIFARVVDDTDENTGPVVRYEREFALPSATVAGTAASQTNIANLTASVMANADSQTQVKEVIELTRGLAEERLFYYSRLGDSITVNGELYHGNEARRVTNTYNFTISPRG
ncbi:MAG: hypothetical protein GVY36_06810 [Verrucomicrobia bacterium]|jgi:hypothetical protein|nr:hypothetical protein [Verrucomicrobiota bacterium]